MTAVAVIDRAAFARNVRRLVERAAPAEVMLAIKADAYGHGMLDLAPVALAAGARSLAVLEIPAALALREAGIDCRLFAWLHGTGSDFAAAIAAGIDLGVSAPWQLDAIASAASTARPARVHLKIDTGLRRNGALPEQWPALVRQARELAETGRIVIDGIWSHLADASVEADDAAIAVFEAAIATAEALGVSPPLRHLAASSAGWREPRARFDLVRFGIAAYGVSPFDDRSGLDLGLEAVMTLRTTVMDAAAPSGRSWIAAGYADGVPAAAQGAEVSIDGHRCAVEAVEVDRTLVVSPPSVEPGAVVTVFGEPAAGVPSAEDWARWSRTIGDEILTGVPARVPRSAVG
ncbi:alanine racemase [Microcella humidisoli]|uniref:Alanine racemase n=1 Tax=Microcella humidisoli TaxID=2963406 RepID=A0ABY5FX17_9MICO|nr:alanine racemase [Microcella humidisoli]UTT62420.1 alanine racemase [Microcella humidisoli]